MSIKCIAKKYLKQSVWYPIIYVINIVTFFYLKNYYQATLPGLVNISIITLIITGLVWLLFHIAMQDFCKSSLLVFVFSALFFSFQNIVNILRGLSLRNHNYELLRFWHSNSGQLMVFLVITVLFTFVFLLVKNIKTVSPNLILFLNIFCLILLSTTTISGITSIHQNNRLHKKFTDYWKRELENNALSIEPLKIEKPDIYYIIVDGFARSDILFDLFDLDNKDFITTLNNKGFYVAKGSYANYIQTHTSLASSLNLQYLDTIADVIGEDKSFFYPAYHMIQNSTVEKSLRDIGYKMVSFRSFVDFTDLKDWEIYIYPKYIPDYFTMTYLNSTGLSPILNNQMYIWHYNLINFVLQKLPNIAISDSPKFVFAHILCPHPPFVFKSDGNFTNARRLFKITDGAGFFLSGTEDEYRKGYREQVVFLQNALIDLIDQIMSSSEGPLIIIIQSDHGSGMQLDHYNLNKTNIKERAGILNAIYFFDEDYDLLHTQISPVNTFRVVFSQYFGKQYEILDDNTFYSKYNNLFDFTIVNNLLE